MIDNTLYKTKQNFKNNEKINCYSIKTEFN